MQFPSIPLLFIILTTPCLAVGQVVTTDRIGNFTFDTSGNNSTTWIDTEGTDDVTWTNGSYQSVTSSSTIISNAYVVSASSVGVTGFQEGDFSGENGTYEWWLRLDPTDYANGDNRALWERGGANGSAFSISRDGSGDFFFNYAVVSGSLALQESVSLASANVSDFFQIAVVNDFTNSETRYYVDGALIGTGAFAATWNNGTDGAKIADGFDNNAYNSSTVGNGSQDFLGEIGVFRVYSGTNGALTTAQIEQNYNAVMIPEPGTAALILAGTTCCLLFGRRRRQV